MIIFMCIVNSIVSEILMRLNFVFVIIGATRSYEAGTRTHMITIFNHIQYY